MTILFFSCNNVKQNETVNISKEKVADTSKLVVINKQFVDSLNLITKCDTIPLELLEISRKRKSLFTFKKQTYLYCSPSAESQIIDSISFNSEVVSWKPIIRSYKPTEIEKNGKLVTTNRGKEGWHETNINGQIGYLFDNGLTMKRLRNNVLFGEKPDAYGYQILSFNPKSKSEIVDSMDLNRNHGYDIESLIYNGLEFCQGVIRYHDFRQSCPGTSTTTFISINNEGALKKIIFSYSGEVSNSTVYFPLKFKSGKTLLVANGNVQEIFNHYSGELNTFDYPKELNVSINEMIVEIKREYSGTLEVPEEDTEISNDTIYYQWNGMELNKIKTTGNNVYN